MAGLHASTFKPSEQSNLQNELVPFGILDHHFLHPLPSAPAPGRTHLLPQGFEDGRTINLQASLIGWVRG